MFHGKFPTHRGMCKCCLFPSSGALDQKVKVSVLVSLVSFMSFMTLLDNVLLLPHIVLWSSLSRVAMILVPWSAWCQQTDALRHAIWALTFGFMFFSSLWWREFALVCCKSIQSEECAQIIISDTGNFPRYSATVLLAFFVIILCLFSP